MQVVNKVIYADPDQTGAALRRELKTNDFPKVFFSRKKKTMRRTKRNSILNLGNEDDARLISIVEKELECEVLSVDRKSGTLLVRTKF